ncbi:MAG: hypothetical protein KDB23_04195 [Planctomycetales bacterium]|nr:hypothetical protein [Planctomycetales bacterium]
MKRLVRAALIVLSLLVVGRATASESVFLSLDPMRYEQQGANWYRPDVLCRELCRQAVLVAARDELGMLTRDAVLREPELPGAIPLRIELANLQGEKIEYRLHTGEEIICNGEFRYSFAHNHSAMAMVATACEELSRGEFADGLRKINNGGSSKDRSALSADLVSSKHRAAEKRLAQWNFASQYVAVRQGHELLRNDPRSLEALSILARGYANLAAMSDHYLTNIRLAFIARSLIYSTRMIGVDPQSATGYLHQAYAFTLFGLTKDSVWQLTLAEEKNLSDEPAWLPLIREANEFDYKRLKERMRKKDANQQLAAYLTFRTVECSESQSLTIETGKLALAVSPACLRIYDGVHRVAGVSYQHATTTVPADIYRRVLVGAMPMLKAESSLVAPCCKDGEDLAVANDRAILATCLQTSSDRDDREPSVAVLGTIVEEINVLQIAQRLGFLSNSLAVDGTEEMEKVRPAFQHHPAAGFVEALGYDRHNAVAKRLAVSNVGSPDLSYISGYHLLRRGIDREWSLGESDANKYWALLNYQSTASELDYTLKMKQANEDTAVQFAKYMADINPFSPQRGYVLINKNWAAEREHVEQWLQRAESQPAIAGALAAQFERDDDLENAEKYWRIYIDAAPDYEAYAALARLLYRTERQSEAIQLCQEFLKHEDYGLSHGQMRQLIANTYMNQKDFNQALPFATAAAKETGAGWAMFTLASCLENLERYDEAAKVLRACDVRYQTPYHYQFVIRTGRGDLEEAWKLQRPILQKRLGAASADYQRHVAVHALLTSAYANSMQPLQNAAEFASTPFLIYYAAVEGGLPQLTEAAEALQRQDEASPELGELGRLIVSALSSKHVPSKDFENLLENASSAPFLGLTHFFYAWCLEQCGEEREKMVTHYTSATDYEQSLPTGLLASQHLRRIKAPPAKRQTFVGLQSPQ